MKTYLPLILLAATLPAAESENEPKRKDEHPPAASAEKLQAAGVKGVAVEAVAYAPEIAATGQVLDPLPLLGAFQEWIGTDLAATAAEQEGARLKKLQAAGGVSAKLLQAAEAEAKKSRVAAFVALQKLRSMLGAEASQSGRLETLLKGLGQGELALIRLDLPPAAEIKGHPTAEVASAFDPEKTQEATWLGQSPMASPLTLGQALLYTLEKPQPSLRPGASVQAKLTLQEKVTAWFIPESALLRADGKTFVYREAGVRHERCPVKLLQRTEQHEVEGWLVSGSLKAGDKVVAQGAFTLLAAETLGDEDEGEADKKTGKPEAKSTEPTK